MVGGWDHLHRSLEPFQSTHPSASEPRGAPRSPRVRLVPDRPRPSHTLVGEWRSGTSRSQWTVLALLLVVVTVCFGISLPFYSVMPVGTYFVWLVVGMLLLKNRQLTVLVAYTGHAGIWTATMFDLIQLRVVEPAVALARSNGVQSDELPPPEL